MANFMNRMILPLVFTVFSVIAFFSMNGYMKHEGNILYWLDRPIYPILAVLIALSLIGIIKFTRHN